MDLKSLFGGVSMGRDTSGNFKLSFAVDSMGLAIRTPDERYYAKDEKGLRDVTHLTLDASDGMVFKLPVSTVKPGDVIVVSDTPFSAVFVEEVLSEGQVRVLDPAGSSSVIHVQPKNLLGQRFFVKAVNLLESFGSSGNENSLLFLLLLGKNDAASSSDNLLPLLLMQQAQGGGRFDNPLMLALLLRGDNSDALETMLLLQALGGGLLGGSDSSIPKKQ